MPPYYTSILEAVAGVHGEIVQGRKDYIIENQDSAPLWQSKAENILRYRERSTLHAEDGAWYNWESAGRVNAAQATQYPTGSVIATFGFTLATQPKSYERNACSSRAQVHDKEIAPKPGDTKGCEAMAAELRVLTLKTAKQGALASNGSWLPSLMEQRRAYKNLSSADKAGLQKSPSPGGPTAGPSRMPDPSTPPPRSNTPGSKPPADDSSAIAGNSSSARPSSSEGSQASQNPPSQSGPPSAQPNPPAAPSKPKSANTLPPSTGIPPSNQKAASKPLQQAEKERQKLTKGSMKSPSKGAPSTASSSPSSGSGSSSSGSPTRTSPGK